MSLWRGLRARMRAIVRSGQAEADLRDEIAFHIERETEKYLAAGHSLDDARRLALLSFGGVTQITEAHRDVRRPQAIEHAMQDARFALRMFARTPVLTAAAVVTIALGIGANAAIFSAVNAVVLRPLPFPHSENLYLLTEENARRGWHHEMVSTANYLDWREGMSAFSDLAAYDYAASTETLSGLGESRRLRFVFVTGNLFATLGVRAARGRTLEDAETWDTTPATVVLSDAAWTREFARDPSVIGRPVTLDGTPVRIVGIMPPTFAFPYDDVDGWLSFRWNTSVRGKEMWRRERWLRVIGRVAPTASVALADAQLRAVTTRLEHDYPATNAYATASILPLHDYLVGDTRAPLLILLGAVALLLLIACGNVANLLLVRAAGRQRELALRLALGAGRRRLVRQAITESLVLACAGGAAGLALGWLGTRAFVVLQPDGLLRVPSFGVDGTVLLYTALVATVTGLLFGLAPALWIQRRDPADVLKHETRAGTQSTTLRRSADALAAGEVALAVVMMVAATLLVRSARQLASVNPGFEGRGVIMTNYALYSHAYDSSTHRQAFHDEFLARARAIPGVTHAAFGSTPLEPNLWRSGVVVHGRASDLSIEVPHMYGSPEWLATLGIPLRAGRFFTNDDRRDLSRVVVNETFARMFFPGEHVVGQQFSLAKHEYGPPAFTIVGVIGDIHETSLIQPPGPLILDQFQSFGSPTLLVRTSGRPEDVVAPLRAIVRQLDPAISLGNVRPLEVLRDREMARSRFFAALLLAFAGVGLVLATLGIYAVLAQIARNRAREMGIRIALGARLSNVRWMIVRHGIAVTAVGLAAGMGVALASTRVLGSLLFGLSPNDPLSYGTVLAILGATGVIASFIPAWRASRANPADVLRAD
jgi:putative ABC transport system permease protein